MNLFIFPLFYLKEIIVGSCLVARDSLFTRKNVDPVVIEIDTSMLTLGQRYTMACLISMTPGTLSVGEQDEGDKMLIHCLYGSVPRKNLLDLEKNYRNTVAQLPI